MSELKTKEIKRSSKWNNGYEQEKYAETESGDRIVETLGYIPRRQRIENYKQAGINLLKFNMQNYDGDNEMKSENFIYNPYRDIGMDFSDYARNQKRLKAIVEKKYEDHNKHVLSELERIDKIKESEHKNRLKSELEKELKKGQQLNRETTNLDT